MDTMRIAWRVQTMCQAWHPHHNYSATTPMSCLNLVCSSTFIMTIPCLWKNHPILFFLNYHVWMVIAAPWVALAVPSPQIKTKWCQTCQPHTHTQKQLHLSWSDKHCQPFIESVPRHTLTMRRDECDLCGMLWRVHAPCRTQRPGGVLVMYYT